MCFASISDDQPSSHLLLRRFGAAPSTALAESEASPPAAAIDEDAASCICAVANEDKLEDDEAIPADRREAMAAAAADAAAEATGATEAAPADDAC